MKRKKPDLEQHIQAAKFLQVARESIANAMRALNVLDAKPGIGQATARETDALLKVHRALDRARLVHLPNSIHRDVVDLDGFADGAAVYQDPYREREVNRRREPQR